MPGLDAAEADDSLLQRGGPGDLLSTYEVYLVSGSLRGYLVSVLINEIQVLEVGLSYFYLVP